MNENEDKKEIEAVVAEASALAAKAAAETRAIATEHENLISIDDFAKIELRTARVLTVEDHPNADKLYVLQVAVGDHRKQIIAGVKEYISAPELIGKTIIIVDNLKPVKLRGEESNGMMLAVRDGDNLAFVTPSCMMTDGLRIT